MPAANRSSSESTVSSTLAYAARHTARAAGFGCTRRRRRVRMPSVPSDPTKSFVRSMPLDDFRALLCSPPVTMTVPSARTTSAPSTSADVVPQRTACGPLALFATMPPSVHARPLPGSGGKKRPRSPRASWKSANTSPGSTTAWRFGRSISTIFRIRANDTTMPPRAATAPPVWPVPAPRGTIGVPVSAATRIAATTSAVVSGTTTTSGRCCIRRDQNDASYAYGSSVVGSSMTRSPGSTARNRSAIGLRVWRAMRSRYRRDISIQTAPIILSSHVRGEDLATCISCGLCLNDCPTYRVLGDEADSPRGRVQLIRQMVTTAGPVDEQVSGHLEACLVCRACETACPSGVPFGRIMEGAREELREREDGGALARTALDTVARPRRLALAARLADLGARLGLARLAARLPGPLGLGGG